jgi:hypothetical protein
MRLKNGTNESKANSTGSAPENIDPADENLRAFRDESERLMDACDQAIAMALSGDSRDFLRQSRQEGGQ